MNATSACSLAASAFQSPSTLSSKYSSAFCPKLASIHPQSTVPLLAGGKVNRFAITAQAAAAAGDGADSVLLERLELPPSASSDAIQQFLRRDYKWGFVSDIESVSIPKGLSEDTVRLISAKKDEPPWLLEFRLNAYRQWLKMREPQWSDNQYAAINFQDYCYYSEPKQKEKKQSLDEVDPALLDTFQKLGIPLTEQKRLANVAVDAVFDSVSIATTHRKTLEAAGVIFCSISEAVKEYPDVVRKYLGRVVPVTDNFYAALNSAVFSDGSFCYIPKDTVSPMEISTYFRINALETGQFERTLIVADERSFASYLQCCDAPSTLRTGDASNDTDQDAQGRPPIYCCPWCSYFLGESSESDREVDEDEAMDLAYGNIGNQFLSWDMTFFFFLHEGRGSLASKKEKEKLVGVEMVEEPTKEEVEVLTDAEEASLALTLLQSDTSLQEEEGFLEGEDVIESVRDFELRQLFPIIVDGNKFLFLDDICKTLGLREDEGLSSALTQATNVEQDPEGSSSTPLDFKVSFAMDELGEKVRPITGNEMRNIEETVASGLLAIKRSEAEYNMVPGLLMSEACVFIRAA